MREYLSAWAVRRVSFGAPNAEVDLLCGRVNSIGAVAGRHVRHLQCLAVADALHSHGADNVALTQAHVLSIAAALHGQAADNLGLLQAHVLAVADAAHAHSAESLVLSFENILQVADSVHAHTADSLTLTQAHILVVSNALHAQLSDLVAVQVPGYVPPPGQVFVVEVANREFVVASGTRTFHS